MHSPFPDFNVIIVPGLHDSGPGHWQTLWQHAHPAFARVRQDDWDQPDLARWSARLDALRRADARPALLVAHSFGCLAAVHSIARAPGGVAAALLVAPADPDKFGVAGHLPHGALGCPSTVLFSSNDPWMAATRSAGWARRWGSALVDCGKAGHINAESGLGHWPAGWAQLHALALVAHNRAMASLT